MRSVAILNQKGGVGKTTSAVNLAAALARAGRRVLLIDLDPQSHATLHLGVQLGPDEPGIYEGLLRGVPLAEIIRQPADRLSLVPASLDLLGAEVELRQRPHREQVLAAALAPYRDAFSFCLVDCPPSLGLLTVNALAAVDEVMIPVQPHFLALHGLGRLLETVRAVRQALNPRLRISGVMLCLYEPTRLAQEVYDDIAGFVARADASDAWYGARLFQTRIRRNIKLAECPSFGQTVFAYAATSHGAEDYAALAREVLRMPVPAAISAPPPAPGEAAPRPVHEPALP
jgi:chromosome partitioning protein